MADKLIGTDIAPPDLVAKITGRARYAEDFRPDGMVFAKLLLSPMPHCRVRGVDVSRALAMDGVIDILRAEEVPSREGPRESCLTDEPHYEGEPVLARSRISHSSWPPLEVGVTGDAGSVDGAGWSGDSRCTSLHSEPSSPPLLPPGGLPAARS